MLTLTLIVFVIGYFLIITEHKIGIDKAASALLTAVILWSMLALLPGAIDLHGGSSVSQVLSEHLGEISEILFFLLGAMTIVELIDAHDGFRLITDNIKTRNKTRLLWITALIAFFLSAVLDNLTTTIVMISVLRKLVPEQKDRWLFASIIIIAANSGGAWSPIGDVTTTMLWIDHRITATGIMGSLFLPSLISLLTPLVILSFFTKGTLESINTLQDEERKDPTSPLERKLVLLIGMLALLFVPVFKTVTHLPPYLGVLFGLSIMWITTELIHRGKNTEDKHHLSVAGVLRKIDTPSILFFLGILLSVASLSSAGHLSIAGNFLKENLGNVHLINVSIGLISAVVDNVPLVAGALNMYPLTPADAVTSAWSAHFVIDGEFWELLAYCAGTGGSCLIIGSAAGVAAMGMEKIDFVWYLIRITPLALAGYFAGIATFFLL